MTCDGWRTTLAAQPWESEARRSCRRQQEVKYITNHTLCVRTREDQKIERVDDVIDGVLRFVCAVAPSQTAKQARERVDLMLKWRPSHEAPYVRLRTEPAWQKRPHPPAIRAWRGFNIKLKRKRCGVFASQGHLGTKCMRDLFLCRGSFFNALPCENRCALFQMKCSRGGKSLV